MIVRSRRLRNNDVLRGMIRETRISAKSLIYPLFVTEKGEVEEISSMPGQYRHTIDALPAALERVAKAGVQSVMLFGIPQEKDVLGSGAYAKDGVIQKALLRAKKEVPELYYITDVCLCEYTSHGHCGVLKGDEILNDESLLYLAQIALSHAQAGSDMVAPSDMMDGRILAIRNELDKNGYEQLPIMSYAVKYASSFYDPFREAAGSAPVFGDRRGYQMDYHNAEESIKEARQDVEQGADIVMVKPALSYLDIISKVSNEVNLPVAAYSVSGEYAMIKAAAAKGYIDEKKMICETSVSIFRAGCDVLLSYYAPEIAKLIKDGVIG